MRWLIAVLVGLVSVGAIPAQASRYELAVRLTQFEKAWDARNSAVAHTRALKNLPDVTGQFFSLQLGKAGRTLDEARFALEEKAPAEELRHATSLYPDVGTRWIDADGPAVNIKVQPFYDSGVDEPKELTVTLQLGAAAKVCGAITRKPITLSVPLPKLTKPPVQDVVLRYTVSDGETVLVERTILCALSRKPAVLAEEIQAEVKNFKAPRSVELATLKLHAEFLTDMAAGTVPESDRSIHDSHAIVPKLRASFQADKPYFTSELTGDHWLAIPTKDAATPCRWWVPKNATLPTPLVVAIHGAGGSENMFFEGYGDGQIRKLCEQRGWFLLAPRAGLGFAGSLLPVAEMIDVLAKRYPIDPKRVYLVGHSMGGTISINLVQKHPQTFAAVAVLGGGGTVRRATGDAFATLPTFLGVGERDFALKSTKQLQAAIEAVKPAKLTAKIYPGLEHLSIVREALPDVFELFDVTKPTPEKEFRR